MNLARILVYSLLMTVAPVAMAAGSGALSPRKISRDVTKAMDRKSDPCKDFYQYACGGWIKRAKLHRSQVSSVRSFSAFEGLVFAGVNVG